MASRGIAAFCIRCGYPLNGVVGRKCPECGRGFDPRDPSTWARGPGRVGRWLCRPPGFTDWALAVAAAMVTLWAYSPPGRFAGLWSVSVGLWFLAVGLLRSEE